MKARSVLECGSPLRLCRTSWLAFVLLACVAWAIPAPAQPFTVDWFTVDGGGGKSSGGQFTVSGTIGQPDASATQLAGGTFVVSGGFWTFDSAATPPPLTLPTLQLQIALTSGGAVAVSAQGTPGLAAIVEATESLTAPITWSQLGNVQADASGLMSFIDSDAPQHPRRFYRFVAP